MPAAQNLLATMITTTTYGTWLPGDLRGYVDNGVILPGDPELIERCRKLMKSDPVLLTPSEQHTAFEALQLAAEEFRCALLEASVESWHVHWLIDHKFEAVDAMVGRLKTRIRQAIGRGRIWTNGYDARYCFNQDSVERRRNYIRRHRGWRPLATPGHTTR
jgi:REP element-mobilizing transposase RayT